MLSTMLPALPKHFLLPWNLLGAKVAPKSLPLPVRIFLPTRAPALWQFSLPYKANLWFSLPCLHPCAETWSATPLCLPKTANEPKAQEWWQQQKHQELILPFALQNRANSFLIKLCLYFTFYPSISLSCWALQEGVCCHLSESKTSDSGVQAFFTALKDSCCDRLHSYDTSLRRFLNSISHCNHTLRLEVLLKKSRISILGIFHDHFWSKCSNVLNV